MIDDPDYDPASDLEQCSHCRQERHLEDMVWCEECDWYTCMEGCRDPHEDEDLDEEDAL